MKNITKKVKVMNLKWIEKDSKGNDVEKTDKVENVVVKVNGIMEVGDVLDFVFRMFGLVPEPLTDEVKASVEFKSLEGLCRVGETQLRHHEGTTATRQKAVEYCKGEIEREELDAFVYEHDYSAPPKQKSDGKARALQLLGLTAEELQMLEELRKVKLEKEEKNEEEAESEDEQEESEQGEGGK